MAIEIDNAAFERCVREYGRAVYRVAWSYSLSRDASDDVFQETFMALWRSGKPFADEEHIRRWLLRVAAYKSKDSLRSASRCMRRNDPLDETIEGSIAAPAEPEADEEVWSLVARLPDDMRAALVMHYCEGYSTEEIADACGCAHATVRTRLLRARRKLEKMLGEVLP